MATKLRSFRLSDEDIAALDALRVAWASKGAAIKNRTEAVRYLIREAPNDPLPAVAPGWEPKPELLQDTQGVARPVPMANGTIQQATRTIKLVSAKGVAPPIKAGQHVMASVNGVELRIDLANCCRLSKGYGAAHTKGCMLKALGYVI